MARRVDTTQGPLGDLASVRRGLDFNRSEKPRDKERRGGKKGSLLERLRTEDGLLERYRADPGLRSKLPDSYLTAEQRRQRRENKVDKAIGDPLAPLDGITIQDLARKITDSEFDPYYEELDRSQAQTEAQGEELARRAAEYFAQLNQGNQARTVAQNVSTGQQDSLLQNIAAQTQGAIQGAQQQGQQAIAQDTALRGEGLQASNVQDLAARMAQAQANTAQGSAATRQGAAQQGFNAETLARQMQGAGAQLGGEVQGDLGRRTQGMLQEILGQREGLMDEQKGAYLETLLGLRDRQGELALAKEQILGDTRSAEAEARADIAETEAEAAEKAGEVNEFGYTEEEWRGMSADERRRIMRDQENWDDDGGSGSGGGRGKPDSGLGSRTASYEAGVAEDIAGATKAIIGGKTREQILRAGGGRTPNERRAIANAANDMAKLGFLSEANVKALQALGVHVRGFPRSRDQARQMGTLPEQVAVGNAKDTISDFLSSIPFG